MPTRQMNKRFCFGVLVLFLFSLNVNYAQESSFDSELGVLRKGIVSMCAQLQAGKPKESQEQLLNDIDSIINRWREMKKEYTENVPVEYSKDPEWGNYLDEVEDNFLIMRQKVEQKNYKRAFQFCGLNCALFVKIHNVNGRTTLTDAMFTIRQNMKLAVSMAKTGNWKGAGSVISPNKKILKELKTLCLPDKIKEFNDDSKSLLEINRELEDIIKKQNIEALNNQFKVLLEKFNEIYFKYL